MSKCLSCRRLLTVGGIDTLGEGYCLDCYLENAESESDCARLLAAVSEGVEPDAATVERIAVGMLGSPPHPSLFGEEAQDAPR